MKIPLFFYISVLLGLLTLSCLSGCVYKDGSTTDTISAPAISDPVMITPEPVQTVEPAYLQERISPVMLADIFQSVPSIRYISMNEEEKRLCIRSDTHSFVNTMLADPNAQDMLMKGGHITGIGTFLPRSAKTMPGTVTCTAAVYISSRNITSAFVIDQEKRVVSQQVIEVQGETHVRSAGNRTILSDAEKIVFVFVTDQYHHADR
jgi:hypothetical protein